MQTHGLIFIQDMAIIMLIAGMATVLCHLFRQPIIIGYILAGIIIGSHTPPFSFITDEITIKTLAELGVIFLMFSLGLEFNLHKLSKVGGTAFIAALFEILIMIGLGYLIGILFGWSKINAMFLGAILAISSTTIIVKALNELDMKNEAFTQIIFGILIIEDIFAILILALLSTIAVTGTLQINDIVYASTKLTSFMIVALLAGILLIPSLLTFVAKFKSNEMLLITVLGLCFGFCLLVVKLNYSMALGAFIIGAIIAESNQLQKIEHLIHPLRDMFSAIFFVSVGLLFNPHIIVEYFFPVVIITAAVIIGKIVSSSFGVLVSGHDGKTSMRVGMGLAQIGEFSFIIASLGITLDVTDSFLYSIAVCVSIITTLTTPYLIRHSDACARIVEKAIPKQFASWFESYTKWIKHKQASQHPMQPVINRTILQIIVNSFIVLALFIAAAYSADSRYLLDFADYKIIHSFLWTLALSASMPFLIAAYQKTRALGMIISEIMNKKPRHPRTGANDKNKISEILPFIFLLVIVIVITSISKTIIPPPFWLFSILAGMGMVMLLVLPWFVRLHARLQVKLLSSLKKRHK